ncbi:unnamed protein product, partial [Nesidiocoris tenuis]
MLILDRILEPNTVLKCSIQPPRSAPPAERSALRATVILAQSSAAHPAGHRAPNSVSI